MISSYFYLISSLKAVTSLQLVGLEGMKIPENLLKWLKICQGKERGEKPKWKIGVMCSSIIWQTSQGNISSPLIPVGFHFTLLNALGRMFVG